MLQLDQALWNHVVGERADTQARHGSRLQDGHAAADRADLVGAPDRLKRFQHTGPRHAGLRMQRQRQNGFAAGNRRHRAHAPVKFFGTHHLATLAAAYALGKHQIVFVFIELAKQIAAHPRRDMQFHFGITLLKAG